MQLALKTGLPGVNYGIGAAGMGLGPAEDPSNVTVLAFQLQIAQYTALFADGPRLSHLQSLLRQAMHAFARRRDSLPPNLSARGTNGPSALQLARCRWIERAPY
jgi:hypothetical protein